MLFDELPAEMCKYLDDDEVCQCCKQVKSTWMLLMSKKMGSGGQCFIVAYACGRCKGVMPELPNMDMQFFKLNDKQLR